MSNEIVSPLPGTFYRKPSPEEGPFKEVGDAVAKGDVIGLVEVMKVFREVQADRDGTIKEFLVGNESEVMAGQPLVILA